MFFQIGTTICPFIVDLGGEINPSVPPGNVMGFVAELSFTAIFFILKKSKLSDKFWGISCLQNFF